MNNLKDLLKNLEEKKEKLSIRHTFVLYFDTVELEFVDKWRDKKSVFKEDELGRVNGLLERLNILSHEANTLILEIEAFQKLAASPSEEPQESSINDYIGRLDDITRRIETLSADCDVILFKLPSELAVGVA